MVGYKDSNGNEVFIRLFVSLERDITKEEYEYFLNREESNLNTVIFLGEIFDAAGGSITWHHKNLIIALRYFGEGQVEREALEILTRAYLERYPQK